MYLATEDLQRLAAASVAAMKTNGDSLNDSIRSIVLDNEMNSDQVKRIVETANQLAYISELDGNTDRTFEFDVANYDDIMDSIVPSAVDDDSLCKAASDATLISPMDLISASFSPIEKVAQEKEATLEKLGRNEKLQALKKIASHEKNRLDELKSAEHDNLVKLAQHKAIVSRDPEALLKMAKFDNGKQMSKLVFGHDKVASEVHQLWHEDDMKHIQALSDRLSMCKQAKDTTSLLQTKVEKAEGILKQAFLAAAIGAAKGLFKSKASSIASAAKGSTKIKKANKAYKAFELADSSNEVRKGTKKNHDAWSSLRG